MNKVIDTQLILIFNDLLCTDDKKQIDNKNLNKNIDEIIQIIINYYPSFCYNTDPVFKEIYILYVFSYLLNNMNEVLKLDEIEFFENIYFKILKIVLTNHLHKVNIFFNKLIKKNINEFDSEKNNTLLNYISLYNLDYNVIKNKILEMFFSNIIFDVNPLEIENNLFYDYYKSTFKYIFYLYLEHNSNNIPTIDELVTSSLGQETAIMSSRYNIYKSGIRLAQINSICYQSSHLRKIYLNFSKVGFKLTSNELQKLYSIIIDKSDINDNQLLVLKFNSENEKLLDIRNKYPQIYNILRSLKIESDTNCYNYYDRKIIKTTLKKSIKDKLSLYLASDFADILSESISNTIETSITEGMYLDPLTLDELQIKGKPFLNELSSFLNMLLDYVDTEETCCVLNLKYISEISYDYATI